MKELKLFLTKLMKEIRCRKEFMANHQRATEYMVYEDMEKSIGLLLIDTITDNKEEEE